MQIIYAVPFLITAAVLFAVLAVIPKARGFAIALPAATIAAGPGSLIGFIITALIRQKAWGVHYHLDIWDGIAYVFGGLLATALATYIVRFVMKVSPTLLIKAIVCSGAFCSYFVLMISAQIGFHAYLTRHEVVQPSTTRGAFMLWTTLIVSTSGAWLVTRNAAKFRVVNNNKRIEQTSIGA